MKKNINLIVVFVVCYVACQRSFERGPIKPMPESCRMTNLMNHQCCVFPPFFIREVARECGARFKLNQVYNESELITLRRETISGCDYWTCVLDKYDFLQPDNFVDDEKYFLHLDRWVALNENFADVITNAKIHCKMAYRPIIPLEKCEFEEFHMCIRNFVNLNCPVTIPTKECDTLKAFFEECKEFYI